MFGRKTTDRLIDNIDKYFDTLDRSLLVYKEGVRNYLYSNRKEFEDNLQSISRFESESSALRREIENDLYTRTSLVRSRADIMRMLDKTRNIVDMLYDSIFQFEIETPFIPSEMNQDFIKLTEFAVLSLEALVPAAKS